MAAELAQARDLPDGDEKFVELERISAYADAAGHVRLAFDARCALLDAYTRRGVWWRLREPLVGCLAALDSDRAGTGPARFDDTDRALLIHHHRRTVAAFTGSSRVGLAQSGTLLDDLANRLQEQQRSLAAVHELRCRIADHLGDEPAARQWLDRWRAEPPDDESGCPGCANAQQAELLAGWGLWSVAAQTVEAVPLDRHRCPEQPERSLVALVLPYLRLGRVEEAGRAHVRAYRRHRRERPAFPYLATHLRFCALTGDHIRGLDILGEQLGRLDRPYDELSAMEFAAAGALVCRLAEEAGLGRWLVARPGYGERAAAELTVTALGAELHATARDLAGRFDARNGTGHQSGRIAAWLAETPLTGPQRLPDEEEDEVDDEPAGAAGASGASGAASTGRADDVPLPLSVTAITAVLDRRGDVYRVDEDGTVGGRWGDAVVQFELTGDRDEILHIRIVAGRRLPGDRLAEAYEFCNAWNHDRLLPKAYVHRAADGELVLAGDVTTDLAFGATRAQLTVLVHAALATGVEYAAAVTALP
ncbi:YbjN domain-containing protein [Micromonospora echinofusca]|uniref:YbjN domain-containing protein n=1 Tax=Micromonospora echinofusca TaxID=47858 RepID=A0ABS3VYL7_MICEH|nr:YbjN domain-containing protein [Micromonospora echinofusca]